MSIEIATVLGLTGITVVLMAAEVLRADLLAWLLAIALALASVITPQETFSGFSGTAVVTTLAVYIMADGLRRTGVTSLMGTALQRLAGGSFTLLLLVTMVGGAVLSLFMQNIAAAAVLMPALIDVARRTKTSPSKLLIPLAFGVNLGGLATLLATSNILVSATMEDLGLAPYTLFDFVPVGVPLIAVGTAYMLFIGRRLLPALDPVARFDRTRHMRRALSETYALRERLSEVYIPADSPLVGRSIAETRIGERLGLNILAICRDDQIACLAPGPSQVLEAEETLIVAGRDERVQQLVDMGAKVLEDADWDGRFSTERVALSEVILAPRGNAAGHTLKELRFREKYGLNVVALWRGGRSYRTDVGDMELRFGDALLVHGTREGFSVLRTDPGFLLLEEPSAPVRTRKGWLAGAIMILTLVVAASNVLPFAVVMMLGALAMVVARCLTMEEAYHSVGWKGIFLIAGMMPIGIALTRSGAAQFVGELLVGLLADWGPLALAGGILFLATALSQVMSGQVTAVVLTPIAVAAARHAGADPRSMAMVVALGCGMVFMTPVSHPVNIFVTGPGGYRFRDFVRAGLPLTLLLFVVVLVLLPVFWPL
jgi:di/tricarboxylate transporter